MQKFNRLSLMALVFASLIGCGGNKFEPSATAGSAGASGASGSAGESEAGSAGEPSDIESGGSAGDSDQDVAGAGSPVVETGGSVSRGGSHAKAGEESVPSGVGGSRVTVFCSAGEPRAVPCPGDESGVMSGVQYCRPDERGFGPETCPVKSAGLGGANGTGGTSTSVVGGTTSLPSYGGMPNAQSGECTPGINAVCTNGSSCSGLQSCNQDGAWEPCQCATVSSGQGGAPELSVEEVGGATVGTEVVQTVVPSGFYRIETRFQTEAPATAIAGWYQVGTSILPLVCTGAETDKVRVCKTGDISEDTVFIETFVSAVVSGSTRWMPGLEGTVCSAHSAIKTLRRFGSDMAPAGHALVLNAGGEGCNLRIYNGDAPASSDTDGDGDPDSTDCDATNASSRHPIVAVDHEICGNDLDEDCTDGAQAVCGGGSENDPIPNDGVGGYTGGGSEGNETGVGGAYVGGGSEGESVGGYTGGGTENSDPCSQSGANIRTFTFEGLHNDTYADVPDQTVDLYRIQSGMPYHQMACVRTTVRDPLTDYGSVAGYRCTACVDATKEVEFQIGTGNYWAAREQCSESCFTHDLRVYVYDDTDLPPFVALDDSRSGIRQAEIRHVPAYSSAHAFFWR